VRTIALTLLACLLAGAAQAAPAQDKLQNQVKAGELVIDPPTLINLGFEWLIQGDDNRNAKVELSRRPCGGVQPYRRFP
jgi:hypothetical protein